MIFKTQRPVFFLSELPDYFQESLSVPFIFYLANPGYLQPIPRAVCRFLIDLLPTGQCLQISARSVEQFWRMPLLSLSAIAASTCAGLLLFRRKDLK